MRCAGMAVAHPELRIDHPNGIGTAATRR